MSEASEGKSRVAIFARAPVRGVVKTRLARDVGPDAALAAYRELLRLTLTRLAPGNVDFAPEIWAAGEPPAAWRRDFPVLPQPAGDLGARMAAAFASGARAVVGCDIPDLTAAHVENALRLLRDADVVIGPTEDGGYCLIAMRRPHPRLFTRIPWGTDAVLATTVAAAGRLAVCLLDPLWDVDTGEDLARWQRRGQTLAS